MGLNGSGRCVSFTNSPLGNPVTPVHRLAVALQEYLYIPDPSPIYAVAGCLAANLLPGDPVWLMLVGPASCGKTTILKALLGVPGVHKFGDISNESALLSGAKRSRESTGGLLSEIGPRGLLVMLDFARTVLNQERNNVRKLLGVIGKLYDGDYSRQIGGDGGRALHWTGKVGFIAATTDLVDNSQAASVEMGERCLYYRYPESDGAGEMRQKHRNPRPEEVDEALSEAFQRFYFDLPLDWDAQAPAPLLESEYWRLESLAQFSSRARSGVDRDWRDRDILSVRQAETPTRMASELAQMYRAMEFVGVTERERWRMLQRLSIHSIPNVRRACLKALLGRPDASTSSVAERARVSKTAAKRYLEDLRSHGVIAETAPNRWSLSPWSVSLITHGWGAEPEEFLEDYEGFNL